MKNFAISTGLLGFLVLEDREQQVAGHNWLKSQFEYGCPECGRDHRHHTAIILDGNWYARCERET